MANEVVIRLDADVAAFLSKMAKANDAMEKTAKKTSENTGDFLTQVGSIADKWMGVAGAVAAVAVAIKGIEQASKDIGNANVAASAIKERANRTSTMLGVYAPGESRDWMSKSSAMSGVDGRVAFMEQVASVQENRRKMGQRELGDKEIKYLQGQYANGGDFIHGKNGADLISDITDPRAASGMDIDRITQRRLRGRTGGTFSQGLYVKGDTDNLTTDLIDISGEGKSLVKVNGFEYNERRKRIDSDFTKGFEERKTNAVNETWMSESTGPVNRWLKSATNVIPGMRDVVGYTQNEENDGSLTNRVLVNIADHIKTLVNKTPSPAIKPNLESRGEGSYGAAYVR